MFQAFYDSMDVGQVGVEIMAKISLQYGQEFVGPPQQAI